MENNIDRELAKIDADLALEELKTALAELRRAAKSCFDAAVTGLERLNRTMEDGLRKIEEAKKND